MMNRRRFLETTAAAGFGRDIGCVETDVLALLYDLLPQFLWHHTGTFDFFFVRVEFVFDK